MLSVPWLEALIERGGFRKLGRTLVPVILALGALKTAHSLSSRRKRVGEDHHPSDSTDLAATPGTLLSKETFSYLLAFVAGWYDVICFHQYKCYANMMTGNSLNLFLKVGNFDLGSDTQVLAAAIVHFSGGFALFKYADMCLKGRWTCTAFAPVVFGLMAAADHFRIRYPTSRWHLLLLAVAGGVVNSISAEKGKVVTNMMTGHYQKLSTDLAEWLHKGLSAEQRKSALHSIRIALTFWSAVTIGMATYNVKHNVPLLARRKFAIVGAIYALLLVLHDLPAAQRRRQKKEGQAE